jgi:hypothetical protein
MPMNHCVLKAGELAFAHIGQIIRFQQIDADRNIVVVTTAELRQISHEGSRTNIVFGELAERDACLSVDHPIVMSPEDDYSDWDLFTGKTR